MVARSLANVYSWLLSIRLASCASQYSFGSAYCAYLCSSGRNTYSLVQALNFSCGEPNIQMSRNDDFGVIYIKNFHRRSTRHLGHGGHTCDRVCMPIYIIRGSRQIRVYTCNRLSLVLFAVRVAGSIGDAMCIVILILMDWKKMISTYPYM